MTGPVISVSSKLFEEFVKGYIGFSKLDSLIY